MPILVISAPFIQTLRMCIWIAKSEIFWELSITPRFVSWHLFAFLSLNLYAGVAGHRPIRSQAQPSASGDWCKHFFRDSERRLYTLRDQLKAQYRAGIHASYLNLRSSCSLRQPKKLSSTNEKPLIPSGNSPLLAVQNMDASGTVAKEQEIEFSALEGSLSMMSKVLNDMLDFNRMDSGKFELSSLLCNPQGNSANPHTALRVS
ncbi:hypothetical protein H0H93_010399 [Arthromyces matolae]|nr:hypothetical protein H0H93_010399 [Arthromyces matolae]